MPNRDHASPTTTSATPTPGVSETQLSAKLLTEPSQAPQLTSEAKDLHGGPMFTEWSARTAARGKEAPHELLGRLSDLGFAWRDIARMIGVSVPAVQKWRRGGSITGDNRRNLASLLAACDLVTEHYMVSEVASWFEMPLVHDAPVTPADLYAADHADLVFDYASGHPGPETVLTDFDPDWRDRYQSDFEVFTAADGQPSLRPKGR
jgi:hypothetical protein